jgi:thiol:disulfide interchange protein DsbD
VWRPYSPELVTEEVAQGRTVVVLFMAQWDPNGYLNLRFFERSSTLRRYSRNPNVAFLIADCTEESAEMEQTMRKLGFRTVPATVIFRPGVAEPRVLMDIVSAEQLLEELNKPAHSGR